MKRSKHADSINHLLMFFCRVILSPTTLSGKIFLGKREKILDSKQNFSPVKNFRQQNFYSTNIFTRWIFLQDEHYRVIHISGVK